MNNRIQIEYLQKYFAPKKARGMAGEVSLDDFLLNSDDKGLSNKLFAGSWIIAPNKSNAVNPVNYRLAVFVLPQIFDSQLSIDRHITTLINERGHQALFTSLKNAGVLVVVSGAIGTKDSTPELLSWRNYLYVEEDLRAQKAGEPFLSLTRGRGRANQNKLPWDKDVTDRFLKFSDESLLKLTLKQAFYYSYLKLDLKASFYDPYDVDSYLVGYSGDVFPMEIKEKSRTEGGEFGIDAGRILMMMRLCIATDSNALYVIREVDNSSARNLIGYKFVTFSDMIMNVSWNLQAGGVGMGGGNTQTIMMPAHVFKNFDREVLKEEWISDNRSLSKNVKDKAVEFYSSFEALVRKI